MVTIKELLPYSYWIGHPVCNRAIVYLFIGFVPLTLKSVTTLNYILTLNTAKHGFTGVHTALRFSRKFKLSH